VHSDIGSTWRTCQRVSSPTDDHDRAVKEGAAAILWIGARERLLLYRHTNSLAGEIDKILRPYWRVKTGCAWREPSPLTKQGSA